MTLELRTDRLVMRPVEAADLDAMLAIRNAPVEVTPIREGSGVDPDNEKSLRALAKTPGARRVDDELYELTAQERETP